MAETAVSFLLDQLSALLREEKKLLGGLEREIQFIRDEMGQMNEFLRVAHESDSKQKEWIKQLREIAYDVEVVLDKYMLRFGPRPGANRFKKVCAAIKNLKARHQIATEIQDIKDRLQNISASQQKYRDLYANMDQGSSSALSCYDGRGDALFLDDDEVVGIEEPKEQLIEWILSMDEGLDVISVVGMGGLGKTTLVKKVYDEESVRTQFIHHVWIIATEYNDIKHMLANLIQKLVTETKESQPQELERMSDVDMSEFISNFLKKKNYIIVVDDVWDISKWNAMRRALPKRGSHGCVVITTRSHSIADVACSETKHVHVLKPLPENESWELFRRKAFPRNPCPPCIREYAEKILMRCQGLPLAISVIGGLLATKGSCPEEWDVFERSLDHELKSDGRLWKTVISLSYNDLPYYLKYCYLYLSIFPEDSLLEKETIIRLWVAEGFVQSKQDISMEEVALHYINDLFNRSLIQVAERDVDGRARAFRIHDLLRDYIVSTSREHNIATITNGGEMQWPRRVRRLAIQKSFSFSQDMAAYNNLGCLHSLVLLSCEDLELDVMKELVGRCRLLKVLVLRGTKLETIPKEVFKLYYLKHLSLSSSRMIKVVPKSIKYLVNLETLDLVDCNVRELPKEILELHRLQNLLVYKYKYSYDIDSVKLAPCDIGRNLPLLTKLSCIEANESEGLKMVREIGKLTELRRLGMGKVRSEDGEELCSSIANLTKLRSLWIYSFEEDEKLELEHAVSLPFLRHLYLRGWIEKVPDWIMYLNGLTTLHLHWSRLREDPLKSLEDLPNLARLAIGGAYFEGLIFKTQGFKKLKVLHFFDLENMKWVIVEAGSMPCLEKWYMKDCKMMRGLPQGIQHLPHLQEISFINMEDEFVETIVEEKKNEGVDWKLAHVPTVYFAKLTSSYEFTDRKNI